jgi:hypothetical protein
MIKIRATQVVEKGTKQYRIDKIEALSYSDLPSEYREGRPCCWLEHGDIPCLLILDTLTKNALTYQVDDHARDVAVGSMISEKSMEHFLGIIRKCGERLRRINIRVRELEKSWNKEIEWRI